MTSCKQIKAKLPAFLAGELTRAESFELEQHLASCAECRLDLTWIRQILASAQSIKAEGDDALSEINWDAMEARIFAQSRLDRRWGRMPVFSAIIQGAIAVCLLFPILFILLTAVPGPMFRPETRISGISMEKMETNIARNEIRQVLSKSRLLLSEFMVQCQGRNKGSFSWQSGGDIRELMAKNRMLERDLNRARLRNARGLCRKLGMVFNEMAAVSPTNGCRDITRLQQLLRKEHIFLKIRLVEEELKRSGGVS